MVVNCVPPQDAALTKAIDQVHFEEIQFHANEKLLHWIDHEY